MLNKKVFIVAIAAVSMMATGVLTAGTQPNVVSAKTKSAKVIKKTTYKPTKPVHVKKGYMYSSTKLTKRVHHMTNYKYTNFKMSAKATIKKSNGKRAIYEYLKSSNGKIKGWIWHGYVTTGNAPKSFASYKLAYIDAVQGSGVSNYPDGVEDLYDIGEDLSSYAAFSYELDTDIPAITKVYNLFKNRFSASQNKHFTSMLNKVKSSPINDDTAINVAHELDDFTNAMGDAISVLK